MEFEVVKEDSHTIYSGDVMPFKFFTAPTTGWYSLSWKPKYLYKLVESMHYKMDINGEPMGYLERKEFK